jgi:hypothetical protein
MVPLRVHMLSIDYQYYQIQKIKAIQLIEKGVTRMAYSPRLWLMAIGW